MDTEKRHKRIQRTYDKINLRIAEVGETPKLLSKKRQALLLATTLGVALCNS